MNILHIVTNVGTYPHLDKPTGLWLGELTHAYDAFEQQGYRQDIASPKGGAAPIDPRSLARLAMDASIRARQDDAAFMALLDATLAASDLDGRGYDAIYYTGGHGVMWDFPDNPDLQRIAAAIYENGGVVSSVCHGYCGLMNIRLSNGRRLIEGKALTGYSWLEEVAAGVADEVPYSAEEMAKAHGADYQKTLIPFVPYAVADGALITGQNPCSAHATAEKVIEFLSRR